MLRLLIDENIDHRILRGIRRLVTGLDFVIAQETDLKGVHDMVLLERSAAENRVLVTHDLKTVPKFACRRIEAGNVMPGVIAIPKDLPIRAAIDEIAIVLHCCSEQDLENSILYLPV